MASNRQQLTAAYSAALLGTLLLVATTFWLEAIDATNARHAQQEVPRVRELLAQRADTVVGTFESYLVFPFHGVITITVNTGGLDSATELAPNVRNQLNELDQFGGSAPNYIAVFGQDLSAIFASNDLTELSRGFDPDSAAVGFSTDTVLKVMHSLSLIDPQQGPVTMSVFGRQMMLVAGRSPPGISGFSHFLVGTDVAPGYAGLVLSGGPSVLGATMLVLIAASLVLVSLMAIHNIASRSLLPVERIINEVEAITDGRSLHKRVAVELSNAKLERLTSTLNAMMERLEISFTALRTFTADASHELNTPLAVLRADVERAMTSGPEEQMVALEEALREIRRMSDLVGSLLTLARADEGRLDMLREPVDLTALTREVYETALLLGEDAGLAVKLTILEKASTLGDRDRLRQLFLNLVTNAIKYTPRGGRVEISLSERLDGVSFSVKDTGVGISQNDLPHVFERFWRADHSRSRVSGTTGFGLGLPIGHWIAQAHGGTLTAISKLGSGSTFTVTLPFEDGTLRPVSERRLNEPGMSSASDRTV